MASSTDTPVLLAVVRPTMNDEVPKKIKKTKTKMRPGATHWLTEGEKRQMLKESSPAKDTTTVKEIMKDMMAKWFPKKLAYGQSPKRMIDHEIEVVPGSEPRHKSPYLLNNAEMEELRNQVEALLE